jgi:hypothetical protein
MDAAFGTTSTHPVLDCDRTDRGSAHSAAASGGRVSVVWPVLLTSIGLLVVATNLVRLL